MDALATARPVLQLDTGLLETLIATSPDALVIVDAARTIVRINPAFARLCGHDAPELEGIPYRDALSHNEAACQLADTLDTAFSHRGSAQAMIACRHGHGFEIDMEVHTHAVVEDGALRYVIAQLRPAWRELDD